MIRVVDSNGKGRAQPFSVGLERFVVLETEDAVVVLPKRRAQDAKKVVERLKNAGRSELGATGVRHRHNK